MIPRKTETVQLSASQRPDDRLGDSNAKPRLPRGSVLALVAVPVFGAMLVWFASGKYGIGLPPTARLILPAAEHLCEGQGYTDYAGRRTWDGLRCCRPCWPPESRWVWRGKRPPWYSIQPYSALTILVAGLWTVRRTGSIWAAGAVMALVCFSPALLRNATKAGSDALFVLLSAATVRRGTATAPQNPSAGTGRGRVARCGFRTDAVHRRNTAARGCLPCAHQPPGKHSPPAYVLRTARPLHGNSARYLARAQPDHLGHLNGSPSSCQRDLERESGAGKPIALRLGDAQASGSLRLRPLGVPDRGRNRLDGPAGPHSTAGVGADRQGASGSHSRRTLRVYLRRGNSGRDVPVRHGRTRRPVSLAAVHPPALDVFRYCRHDSRTAAGDSSHAAGCRRGCRAGCRCPDGPIRPRLC